MSINEGIIYTEDNCIGCNRCISCCPIPGANIATDAEGRSIIRVNDEYCLHCGHCMEVCSHDARAYLDDTDRFFEDLAAGESIALAVSPALYLLYAERMPQILGYLRSLGAGEIYDVAYGADISVWCHLHYLETNKDENGHCPACITPECPAVVSYIRKYASELLPRLIPVRSSVACLGVYVRKYLKNNAKIAYLSPCIARTDEFHLPENDGIIAYNVTFRHLEAYLHGKDISTYHAKSSLKPVGFGATVCAPDGFEDYIRHFLSDEQYSVRLEGNFLQKEQLRSMIPALFESEDPPAIVSAQYCAYGCVNGSALPRKLAFNKNLGGINTQVRRANQDNSFAGDLTVKQRRARMEKAFKSLNAQDFYCRYEAEYTEHKRVSEETCEEIFLSMYKTTPESRAINCGACGYANCYTMVCAIAEGNNKRENCVQFAHEEIRRLYFVDQLTGLSNEAAFIRDTRAMLRAHPVIQYELFVGDVDNLQVLNDMYGYKKGNEVLLYLADALRAFTVNEGTCARLSGNRFALCVPRGKSEKLIERQYFDCSHLGVRLHITFSAGLYRIEKGEEDIARAIEYAALPINFSDDLSRSTCQPFKETMRNRLLREAEMTERMHEALANEEFKIYLQPQFNHSTGALVGVESLCRWIKDDGTMISPEDFIPLFERNGFIRALDVYMWDKAFALVRSWLDRSMAPVPLSVNISRISLLDEEMADTIHALREKYNVPAELIQLEITESAYMRDQARIISTTRRLQKQGFLVAMDDFGSGYSSLNTLKDVPFDILKLDMGFMQGENETERGGNILASIMRMAQNLKILTIAEGVEKRGQADYLKSLGCDIIQGFFYARPMPIEEFEQILRCGIPHEKLNRPAFMNAIDVNRFFEMDSAESRMFDYYCGPSVIMEYERGCVNIIRINDRYLQALGLDKESFEQVRSEFMETLVPESRIEFLLAIENALEAGTDAECVSKRLLPGNPEPIWIKSHFSLIASNGDRHVFYGSAENISREKNTETMLREANERINMVLEYSPAGICLFRTTMKGVIFSIQTLTVNKGFCKMSGYRYEELINWGWDDFLRLVYPGDRVKFAASMISSLATTRKFSMVYRAVANDGQKFHWVKIDATAVQQEDDAFLTFANFTDLGTDEQGPHV